MRCDHQTHAHWLHRTSKGCHQLVHASIGSCDTDVRQVCHHNGDNSRSCLAKTVLDSRKYNAAQSLWGNVVVTGGLSQLKGYNERLQFELARLAPVVCTLLSHTHDHASQFLHCRQAAGR